MAIGTKLDALELKILQRIADGKTSREIAEELEMSTSTVDCNYRRKILDALGAANMYEAIAIAFREGLLQ